MRIWHGLLLPAFALTITGVACAQRPARTPSEQVAALAERGRLADAEAAARAGGPSLTVALADVLVRRGALAEADSLYRVAIRGRLPEFRSALASRAELAARHGLRDSAIALARQLTASFERGGPGWNSGDLVAAGRAYRVIGLTDPQAFHTALSVFDSAATLDQDNLDARLLAADMLLEKYNAPDAKESYQEVLQRAPKEPRAELGLATVAEFAGDARATEMARTSVEDDPALVGGYLLLARLHLEAEAYDSAAANARRALAVDSSAVPAWAVLGAIAWMQGDTAGMTAALNSARRVNPRPADFFSAIAEAAARQRRYADAVELASRAVALDSSSAWALTVLGTNELRTGRMVPGREHIERAFTLDPYNLWNKNTLDLFDQLKDYKVLETPRFQMVVPPDEADYYAVYLGPLLEAAYDTFATRYQFRPPTPIRVELYRSHADFSVRGTGLAGLGALGVSFGAVVALDAPSARAPGEFNYGSTAWHELAHTFTLGLSQFRTPRWFSEGLSVLEERRAGHGWGMQASPEFLAAYKGGLLLPVSRINDGFVRPAYPAQVTFSYYEASLICEMIEAEKGIAGIRGMLHDFGAGLPVDSVLRHAYGLSPAAFDAHFDGWFRKRFATPLANIDAADGKGAIDGRYLRTVAEGAALIKAGALDSAAAVLARAVAMFPDDGGPGSAMERLAAVDDARQDYRAAAAHLAEVTARGETALDANRLQAEVLEHLGDQAGAIAALDRVLWIQPFDAATHVHLAELTEAAGDLTRAVRERRAVLTLAPPDRLEARYQLARVLARAGLRAEARRQVLQVLEDAPTFEKAQTLLLQLQGGGTTGGRP